MHCRPSLSSQRRFCGVMLLVWLMAVLSGAVHACVLTAMGPGGQAAAWPATVAGGHAEAHAHHHHHDADHRDRTHALDEHVACHKFCVDQGNTPPPQHQFKAQDFSPVLMLIGSPLLPALPAAPPVARLEVAAPAHGPPLPIRFLRLTL